MNSERRPLRTVLILSGLLLAGLIGCATSIKWAFSTAKRGENPRFAVLLFYLSIVLLLGIVGTIWHSLRLGIRVDPKSGPDVPWIGVKIVFVGLIGWGILTLLRL